MRNGKKATHAGNDKAKYAKTGTANDKLVTTMKINLKVTADFDLDGTIMPRAIEWEDGRVFSVDRVLDVRRAASLKAGGVGTRYICRICGKNVALFNDENKWFMET